MCFFFCAVVWRAEQIHSREAENGTILHILKRSPATVAMRAERKGSLIIHSRIEVGQMGARTEKIRYIRRGGKSSNNFVFSPQNGILFFCVFIDDVVMSDSNKDTRNKNYVLRVKQTVAKCY